MSQIRVLGRYVFLMHPYTPFLKGNEISVITADNIWQFKSLGNILSARDLAVFTDKL